MSHAPWSKEQSEQWAREYAPLSEAHLKTETFGRVSAQQGFLAGLAKAAEMIEACPTLYQHVQPDIWCEVPYDEPGLSKHQAKLVGVKPIGGTDEHRS